MTVLAQDSTRFSALVKHEYEPQLSYCRESITINDAAATLKVGAVLGKVTATGKYKLCLSAAVDGSQTPAAILIADGMGSSTDIVLAATTDTKAIVLVRGPVIVADAALQLGTGTTAAAVKSTLAPAGIMVETAI
jgi:hypothetical protein